MVMVLSQSISHSRINHALFVLQEKIHLFLNGSLFAEVEDTSRECYLFFKYTYLGTVMIITPLLQP